jgi:hypothetical protein
LEARVLAAAPDDVRIYETFDGGQSWQLSRPGIETEDYLTPTYNFFVTDDGDIWTVGYLGFMLARHDSSTTSVDDEAVQGPSAAPRLQLASPNPFRQSTTIGFDLPVTSHVRLAVYDPSGRAIASLVEGRCEAGSHQVRWDGNDAHGRAMSSGVFLVRLIWERGSESRKMLLVR